MLAIHHSYRFASAPGHRTIAKKSSNITSRSPRKADFQPLPQKVLAQGVKITCESEKTLTSIAQKRHDFGALTCSKRSLQSCAEQNHPRENIGEIPKEKNRVHFDSDAQHIASL